MDFLLECIGFPPDHDLDALAHLAREGGESVAWRGPAGEHLRLDLGDGLELRMDREEGSAHWTLLPYFRANHRLRVAVETLERPADSPFDVLVTGWANPPARAAGAEPGAESWHLSATLTDARRVPLDLIRGHVLGLALAGFALDVEDVLPPSESSSGAGEAWIGVVGGADAPGGCVELSLPVRSVRELANGMTGAAVVQIEVDAPGRPLELFVSPWQLEADGLLAPSPGSRIEGIFLLSGRVAGGIDGPSRRVGRAFG